ncbi:MAG: hypothetical protein Q8M86_00390 [Syntrophales bacterium]|nr:hypothetical protein [Syntrophales bacterium]
MEPAIAERLRRFFRLVPITLHHTGPLDDDLSCFTLGNFLAIIIYQLHGKTRDRRPHRSDLELPVRTLPRYCRAGLGTTIAMK